MQHTTKLLAATLVLALVLTSVGAMPTTTAQAKKTTNGVTVTKPNGPLLVLKKGKSFTIKAKAGTKKGKAVSFTSNKPKTASVNAKGRTSNKPKTASVNAKGRVTALKSSGSAVITVRSLQNKKKAVKIKVHIGRPVGSLAFKDDNASMQLGESLNLSKLVSVNPKNATERKLQWTSGKTKVATVNAKGVVTAKAPGVTKITAASTDGGNVKASVTLTVYAWRTGSPIKDKYAFPIGVAIPAGTLTNDNEWSRLANYHFNSVTAENDMKPASLLDWQASEQKAATGDDTPVIKFGTMDSMLDYAKANNLKVRFHTLVWFNQTPEWFFHEGYATDKPLVSADTMKRRMESYITQIIDHVETKYPGLVYAWDVVNEAVDSLYTPSADKEHFYMRTQDNFWYKTIGWEYVKCAFQYARNAMNKNNGSGKLFYNDYMERPMRDQIIAMLNDVNAEGKLCDGMGCQAHFNMNNPINYKDYWLALQAYQAAGFEIQITELDVMVPDGTKQFEEQAQVYRTLFDMFLNVPAITGVTLWGVDDGSSWRSDNLPLIFDGNLTPKRAYYAVMQDPGIPVLEYR